MHLEKGEERVAVEISVAPQVARELRNIEKRLAAGYNRILCLFVEEEAMAQVRAEAQTRWPVECGSRVVFGLMNGVGQLI